MLKLYTKTICPKCLWVKSELSESKLPVEIINLDHSEEAMKYVQGAGFSSVPLLESNGEWFAQVPDIIAHIEELAK